MSDTRLTAEIDFYHDDRIRIVSRSAGEVVTIEMDSRRARQFGEHLVKLAQHMETDEAQKWLRLRAP